METIYGFINLIVLPFWGLMILLPRWEGTRKIIRSFWPFALVPLVYAGLLISQIGGMTGTALDFSLQGIASLLGTPEGALIGWAHFLALDLFTGRWVYLDSQERNYSRWLVSSILFFVFMSGPVGLLLYLGLRSIKPAAAASSPGK